MHSHGLLRHRRHRLHRSIPRAGAGGQPRGPDLRALPGGFARPSRAADRGVGHRSRHPGDRRPGRARPRHRPRVDRGAARRHRALLPPRGDLRHDGLRRDERDHERRRHPQRRRAGRQAEGGPLPPGLVGRGLRRLPRGLRRVDVRRGPEAAVGVPPHQVRVGEDRPRGGRGAVAGLPSGDRGGSLRDRGDGQDRRPLLLLPADQADARQPARLDAAGRRRPRRHQRGAGRLRRQGDGPHRAQARPRRPGLPPGQPRAAEHRRAGQLLRLGRQGAAVRRTRRPHRHVQAANRAPPPGLPPGRAGRCRAAAGAGAHGPQPDHRPAGRAARGARARVVPLGLRLPVHREGAGRLRHLGAGPRVLRLHPVVVLGGDARRLHQEQLRRS